MIKNLQEAYPKIPMNLLKDSRIVTDRLELIKLLPRGGIVAEVGVALGEFSRYLLDTLNPSVFMAIDLFNLEQYEKYGDTDLKKLFAGNTQFEFYKEKFHVDIACGQMIMKQGCSWEVLGTFSNDYFDIVYLDADHSYEATKKDLNALKNKMRDGGIVVCDDYDLFDLLGEQVCGVPKAAHEFIVENSCDVLYFSLDGRGYYNIAFRVNKNER